MSHLSEDLGKPQHSVHTFSHIHKEFLELPTRFHQLIPERDKSNARNNKVVSPTPNKVISTMYVGAHELQIQSITQSKSRCSLSLSIPNCNTLEGNMSICIYLCRRIAFSTKSKELNFIVCFLLPASNYACYTHLYK